MKKRHLVQKLSTFLSFANANKQLTHDWLSESELEQNIKRYIEDCPEKTAEQWALHFLGELQRQRLDRATQSDIAAKHLSAYLQEACYQAAQKIQKQFQWVQSQYTIEDLFQIGNILVHQPVKLFGRFKSEHPYSSLESYAKTAIFRFIGNTIYAQGIKAEREKFSDYGLLRDLNQKELKEALAAQGLDDRQIDSYCLASHCFNTVCQPQQRYSSRRLEAPSQAELDQITTCYNQRHLELNLSIVPVESVQAMLALCIQTVRNYQTKRVLHDEIVAESMTAWETVVQAEHRPLTQVYPQLEASIAHSFTAIPAPGRTLLKLWLGLDLTQTEIVAVMRPKYPEIQNQYQVALQLSQYNRNFLKDFLQQYDQSERDLDHQEIERIEQSLEDCLQDYCQRLMAAEFVEFSQRHHDEQSLFVFTRSSHSVRLLDKKQSLIQAFEQYLEEHLKLSPESLQAVHEKIGATVLEWQRSTLY